MEKEHSDAGGVTRVACMQETHPVDRLFDRLRDISPYPDGVVPIPDPIEGTAFFPGGAGLWGTEPDTPLPPMPIGQVMIPGHDGPVPVEATVVGLTHPCMWHRCVMERRYGALRGKEAELQMLKEAVGVAGVPGCSM